MNKTELTNREKLIKQNLPQITYYLEKATQHLKELDLELSNELKELQLKIINKFLEDNE